MLKSKITEVRVCWWMETGETMVQIENKSLNK